MRSSPRAASEVTKVAPSGPTHASTARPSPRAIVRRGPFGNDHVRSVPCGLSGTRRSPRLRSNAMPSRPAAVPEEGSSNKVVRDVDGGRSVTTRFRRCSATASRPSGSNAMPSGVSGSAIVCRIVPAGERWRRVPCTGSLTHIVPSAIARRSSGAARPRARTGRCVNAWVAEHTLRSVEDLDAETFGSGILVTERLGCGGWELVRKGFGVTVVVHATKTSSPATTTRLRVKGPLRNETYLPANARTAFPHLNRDERRARDFSSLLDLDIEVAGARTEVHAETGRGRSGRRILADTDAGREEPGLHAAYAERGEAVHAV